MPATPSSSHALVPHARAAGLAYLVILVSGVAGAGLIRDPLLVPGDAVQTAAHLAAAELPFRWSILADVAMAVADIALAVLLYFLLRPVSHTLSFLAMAFRLVQAAAIGLNLLNLTQAVAWLGKDDEQVLAFFEAHAVGYDLGLFFFAANCFLVGALVVRSGFIPKAIGALLAASGCVYLVGSVLRVVFPELSAAFGAAYVLPLVGELAFCGWLLVKGVRAPAWQSAPGGGSLDVAAVAM